MGLTQGTIVPSSPAASRQQEGRAHPLVCCTMAVTPMIVSFVGTSGVGKTTVVEALVPLLRASGLRVGTVKHGGATKRPAPTPFCWQVRRAPCCFCRQSRNAHCRHPLTTLRSTLLSTLRPTWSASCG